jgi:hypothetical protein
MSKYPRIRSVAHSLFVFPVETGTRHHVFWQGGRSFLLQPPRISTPRCLSQEGKWYFACEKHLFYLSEPIAADNKVYIEQDIFNKLSDRVG